jgi:hypothetical protein
MSPGFGPTADVAAHAVAPTTNSEPAASQETPPWAWRQILGSDRYELGVAGTIVGEADHLVTPRRCRERRGRVCR